MTTSLRKFEVELFGEELEIDYQFPLLKRQLESRIAAQKRKAEIEASQQPVHLVSRTTSFQPIDRYLKREKDESGPHLRSISFSHSSGSFAERAQRLIKRNPEPIIALVEEEANLKIAVGMIKLMFSDSLPEQVRFLCVVSGPGKINSAREHLDSQFSNEPQRLIGIIPRGKDSEEFCGNIMAALLETFPPPNKPLQSTTPPLASPPT